MTDLQLDVRTSPMRDLGNGGQFSSTTATPVLGPTEAVLVDTRYMETDVAELARRITTSGWTLTAFYVTHAHADHRARSRTLGTCRRCHRDADGRTRFREARRRPGRADLLRGRPNPGRRQDTATQLGGQFPGLA